MYHIHELIVPFLVLWPVHGTDKSLPIHKRLTDVPRPPTAKAADIGGHCTEISGHRAENFRNLSALGLSGFSAGTRKPDRPIALK
jgi:hypothetical protein